ncbi:MAG TPA: hypothetical protein DCM05_02965 [Elusimicrobia bacterium]|nr:hypothetical protein [Elusimicrobiota bacterium]
MLSVLVPCFDEAEGLPRLEAELFPALSQLANPFEVLAVDDGSADATRRLLREMASRHPGMKVLSHARNAGIGASLKTGLAAAQGEWLVPLDADLTFHPRHIGEMLAAQRESLADCVCGSPFLAASAVPLRRRAPSLAVNLAYRALFGFSLTAYTPMFRLYRVSALRAIAFESDGFEVSAEILVRMIKAGFKAVDVPVPLGRRLSGASKLRELRELKAHLRLIARLLGLKSLPPRPFPS